MCRRLTKIDVPLYEGCYFCCICVFAFSCVSKAYLRLVFTGEIAAIVIAVLCLVAITVAIVLICVYIRYVVIR